MKYMKGIRERFGSADFPTFRASDLRTMGLSRKYTERTIHLLLAKNEITRITKGVYTFHRNIGVAGFAFQPFYYGLEDALRIRGLSMQGTNPIVVTTRNVRQGVRKFADNNYVVKRIGRDYFFGYELVRSGDFWFPVSDLEKTVIDMFYFGDGIRDELWPGILKNLRMQRLREYLKIYKKSFQKKVLDGIRSAP